MEHLRPCAPAITRSTLLFGGAALLAGMPLCALAEAPKVGAPVQGTVSAAMALARLRAGNQRFASGHLSHPDNVVERRLALSGGQAPWASILSCADSRTSPELAFDANVGELFVVRVAGNFLGEGGLGSLEYGNSVLGSHVILVLGHTACGAIGATYDAIKSGKTLPPHLDALQNGIAPGIEAVVKKGGTKDEAGIANVKAQVAAFPERSDVLAAALKKGSLKIVGGMYDLSTGVVTFV